MKKALNVITKRKNFGVLIARNSKKNTTGIITDGQIRRANQKNKDFQNLSVKDVYTKNPISVDQNMLAVKALELMNSKKITSLCVHENKNKNRTKGIIHLHHILSANI